MPSDRRHRSVPYAQTGHAAFVAELAKLDPESERALANEGFGASSETSDDLLDWLQAWYESHCDDDWEHGYGVRIDTLDNPGWQVRIDLTGTSLAGRTLDQVHVDRSETDWLRCWVEDDRFEAAGGARNLTDILRTFHDWVEGRTT